MRRLLPLILLVVALPASAQLSGVYGIPSDFPSLSAAVAALNAQGVSGPVRFDLAPGTYAERVRIGAVAGASASAPITIRSATADPADVMIAPPVAGSEADNHTIWLDGARHVRLQALTFVATSATYQTAVHLDGDVTGVRILDSVFRGGQATGPGGAPAAIAIRSGEAGITGDGLQILRNAFPEVDTAVDLRGASFLTGFRFVENVIDAERSGLALQYAIAPLIIRNRIDAARNAIYLEDVEGATAIRQNRTYSRRDGIHVKGRYGGGGEIVNNFVTVFPPPPIGGNSRKTFAIWIEQNGWDVYHNSVMMLGDALGQGGGLLVDESEGTDVKNNALGATGQGIPYVIKGFAFNNPIDSGYNALSTSGYIGQVGGGRFTSLAEFLTALDAFDDRGDPEGVGTIETLLGYTNPSTGDLHTTAAALQSAGVDVGVLVDIDGEARPIPFRRAPDIGADETGPSPLVGLYSVGTPGADFPTLDDALAALDSTGVGGPVQFDLAPGTYTKRIRIQAVYGASAQARVVFTARQGGVVFRPTSLTTNTNNYIIWLDSAPHVWLVGLTFDVSGVYRVYQTAVLLDGDVTDVRLTGNTFTGGISTGTPPRDYGYVVRTQEPLTGSDLFLLQNTFSDIDSAIKIVGDPASPPSNVRVVDNTISSFSAGVSLSDVNAPLVIRNRIDARTDAILLERVTGATAIRQNRIFTRWDGIDVSASDGTAGAEIVNNTVSIFPSPVRNGYGIRLNASPGWRIVHNSAMVLADILDGRGFTLHLVDSPGADVQNNALGATGRAIPYWISGASAPLVSGHNALQRGTGAIGVVAGTPQGTLLDFVAALDAYDPDGTEGTGTIAAALGFANARQGDLHTTATALQAAGIDLGVAVDLDGDARPNPSGTAPDIGADETGSAAASAVASASVALPTEFALGRPFPNPASGVARIPYDVPQAGAVTVEVWDTLGRRVAVLADGVTEAGTFEARFDTRPLASGVYIVRMQAGAFSAVRRLTLVR